ncbi:7525_t:CDS:2, partial [Paraglomus occultum]
MYQQIATRISRRAVIKHEIAISRVAKANIKAFHSTRTRAFSNPKDPPNTPPSPLKPTKDVVKEVGVEETLSNETTSNPSTAGAKEDIDKIGQAPDDAQSQQSRDSNGYEASDFVLRSTRRRRMGATLRGRQRTGKNLTPYKPVIPDEFLKTNYIRFTENLASFDTMEYPLQECIRQEIVCSARASLLATPISDSVPAKRGHLLLNCPLEGATYYLDAIVNSTAACLHADLLKFDRQDLMELTADVFARKSNITPWPLFPDLKGFNPYISASPYSTASSMSAEEDVDEDVYIEEEDTYDASHHMTKFPAFDNKAYSETLPFNGSNNTAATRGDMKTMMDKINKFFEALVVVKPLTDLNEHTARRNATSKLKIIYFKDIGDIPPSNFTVQLVNSLVDAVQARRAMGEKILIIAGYSPSLFAMEKKPPSACVVPHELHLMNSDVFPNPAMLVSFTHIAIPPPSDDMAKKLLDLISRDKNLAIRYLNTRNIKAVGASKGAYFKCNSVEELGRILARLDGIDTEVWGFERIHRLVMNAIGLALERHDHVTSNGRVDIEADHFIRAANILRVNQNLRKNFVESVSNSAKIGTKNVANVISVLGVGDVKVNIVNSKSLKLGELDRYEKRFSGCIVEAANIQTGFSDIHVTQTTIETLQTLITLPLLRPDYFSYGVLKKHFISGVLLFGPPGTGKTMLAKAVAKESGSAVLDIKASDVYDMYVGE